MRGKFLHNEVIIAPLLLTLTALGYPVSVEHPVRSGQRPRCVDLFFVMRGKRIVIEAECSCARVASDLAKARKLSADLLLIIVPHARLRSRARAGLKALLGQGGRSAMHFEVLTLGAALRWVFDNCPPAATRPLAGGIQTTGQSPH